MLVKGFFSMTKIIRPSSVLLAALALLAPLAVAAAPAAPASAAVELPTLVINEVDASGEPKDWIELKNTGTEAVDASGLILRDEKDSSIFTIPEETSIPAGGYAAFEVADDFGLGKGGDSARLFLADGETEVDSFTWSSDASPGSWGRCADGTGEFTANATKTRDAVNDCGKTEEPAPTTATAWPGSPDVATASVQNFFGTNMSGLSYELGVNSAADTLWAVKNGPGTLYRLQKSGTDWVPATDNGWGSGKTLHYVDGTGDVDAEGVVHTGSGTFVSSERDNSNNGVSRPSVLRYDTTPSGTSLNATIEWNLGTDLPTVGANLGLEGMALVPDSYLVSTGFIDEQTGVAYNPATYANHGSGLFFVGLEGTGSIYAYALNQTDGTSFTRVATILSGFPSIMELQFDTEKQALWAVCDNTCGGQFALLKPATTGTDTGHFAVTSLFDRPTGLGDFNNEGFVTAPQALCVNGVKPAFWADDDQNAGYSLRSGTISCIAATKPAPSETLFTADARGPVTVPEFAEPGETIDITLGASFAGAVVDVWVFSTPVRLATLAVPASGTVSVTIPASLAVGAHRIAVVSADGSLLGWADITISDELLAATGVEPATGTLTLAALLLLVGAGFVMLRRRTLA